MEAQCSLWGMNSTFIYVCRIITASSDETIVNGKLWNTYVRTDGGKCHVATSSTTHLHADEDEECEESSFTIRQYSYCGKWPAKKVAMQKEDAVA